MVKERAEGATTKEEEGLAAADVGAASDAAAKDAAAKDDASSSLRLSLRLRLCSPQSVILLCILPFANICGFLWIYTALPLHFVDR